MSLKATIMLEFFTSSKVAYCTYNFNLRVYFLSSNSMFYMFPKNGGHSTLFLFLKYVNFCKIFDAPPPKSIKQAKPLCDSWWVFKAYAHGSLLHNRLSLSYKVMYMFIIVVKSLLLHIEIHDAYYLVRQKFISGQY